MYLNTRGVELEIAAFSNSPPLLVLLQVVIGSGAAGLLSVIMANGLGKTCALVEQHAMGGDCLNVGCVPSKVCLLAPFAPCQYVASCSWCRVFKHHLLCGK